MYTNRASPHKQQDQLQEPRSPTLLAGMHEPRELDVLCSTQYVARRRREEFQAWVCSKSQTPRRGDVEGGSAVPSDSSSHVPQDDAEERRAARFQLFKERQTAASAARVQSLEAVRARAAAFLARRERALAKVANAGEALGQALQRQMAAADERRSALLEAERYRLKQEHVLVLTTARLARSREEVDGAEARSALQRRLAQAEEARNARLAHAAAKAGSKVARAKEVSALTKQLQASNRQERLAALMARLETASQRRLAAHSPASSPNPLAPCPPAHSSAQRGPSPSPHRSARSPLPTSPVLGPAAAAAAGEAPLAPSPSIPLSSSAETRSGSTLEAALWGAGGEAQAGSGAGRARSNSLRQGQECLSEPEGVMPRGVTADSVPPHSPTAAIPAASHPWGHTSHSSSLFARPQTRTSSPEAVCGPTLSQGCEQDSGSEAWVSASPPPQLPGNSGAAAWKLLSSFRPWEATEQVEQDVSARAAEAGLQGKVEALRRSSSSRKLQAAWRVFKRQALTTSDLAAAFVRTGVVRVQIPGAAAAAAAAAAQGPHPAPEGGASESVTQGNLGVTPPLAVVMGPGGAAVVGAAGGGQGGEGRLHQFDAFAKVVQSRATLGAASALLKRLATRLLAHAKATSSSNNHNHHCHPPPAAGVAGHRAACSAHPPALAPAACGGASQRNVTLLLRRLFPGLPKNKVPDRYPPRVFLCALMMLRHPEVVFSGQGPQEDALQAAATTMVSAFEQLLTRILDPPPLPTHPPALPPSPRSTLTSSPLHNPGGQQQQQQQSVTGALTITLPDAALTPAAHTRSHPPPVAASPVAQGMSSYRAARAASLGGFASLELPGGQQVLGSFFTIGEMLVRFDEAWLQYLDQFVAWKLEDAASLEAQLVGMAAEMERSLSCKRARIAADAQRSSPGSRLGRSMRNMEDMAVQVEHDQVLLRERVFKLSGPSGLARLDAALDAARLAGAADAAASQNDASQSDVTASETESEREGTTPHSSSLRTRPPTHTHRNPKVAHGGAFTTLTPPQQQQQQHLQQQQQQLGVASAVHGEQVEQARAGGKDSGPSPPPPSLISPATSSQPAPLAGAAAGLGVGSGEGGPGTASTPPGPPPSPPTSHRPGGQAGSAVGLRRGFFAPANSAAPSSSGSKAAGSDSSSSPPAPTPLLLGGPPVPAPPPQRPPQQLMQLPLVVDVRAPSGVAGGLGLGSLAPSPGSVLPSSPAAPADTISNLQMVWELVHDPGYALSNMDAEASWGRAVAAADTPLPSLDRNALSVLPLEEAVASLRHHAQAVAEAAFWDNLTQKFTQALLAVSLLPLALPLLSDLGTGLADTMADSTASQQLRQEFSPPTLTSSLTSPSSSSTSGLGERAGLVVGMTLVMERLALLLLRYGAPAREDMAAQAHSQLRAELAQACQAAFPVLAGVQAGMGQGVGMEAVQGLGRSLARAVRLLQAQLKLLKLDAANGRLALLARQVRGIAGITYLRSKFAALHGIHPDDVLSPPPTSPPLPHQPDSSPRAGSGARLATALPRTAAWLRSAATTSSATTAALLSTAGLDLGDERLLEAVTAVTEHVAITAATNCLPAQLRSGLRLHLTSAPAVAATLVAPAPPHTQPHTHSVTPSLVTSQTSLSDSSPDAVPAPAPAPASTAPPRLPVAAASWQGVVRLGVLALVTSDQPAVSPALAETLAWDAQRLHAAQNSFQRLLVVCVCMGLVASTRAGCAVPQLNAHAGQAAKRRLLVLLADSSVGLPDVVTELSRLVAYEAGPRTFTGHTADGGHTVANGPALNLEEEAALSRSFKASVEPGSVAFSAVKEALSRVLTLHLVLGPLAIRHEPAVRRAAASMLAQEGAAVVAEDLAQLAQQLLALCGVSEAVHGEVYARMCDFV